MAARSDPSAAAESDASPPSRLSGLVLLQPGFSGSSSGVVSHTNRKPAALAVLGLRGTKTGCSVPLRLKRTAVALAVLPVTLPAGRAPPSRSTVVSRVNVSAILAPVGPAGARAGAWFAGAGAWLASAAGAAGLGWLLLLVPPGLGWLLLLVPGPGLGGRMLGLQLLGHMLGQRHMPGLELQGHMPGLGLLLQRHMPGLGLQRHMPGLGLQGHMPGLGLLLQRHVGRMLWLWLG